MCTSWNISPSKIQTRRIYNTWLQRSIIEDEECAHCDAHFQEELDSLKLNMARITSLLEQTLNNISSEGSSNRLVNFAQA
jgi:hypothetical protein